MWRPMEGYGALSDCGCGCSSGFGAASGRRYPSVEKVLSDYVAAKQAAGQYFWINPELNTSVLRQQNFGDISILSPLTDAISNAATNIGDTISNAWGSSSNGYVSPNLDPSLTAFDPTALFPTLPSGVAAPAAAAAKTDLLGSATPWLIGGAAVLLFVVALSSIPPPSRGRRK